MTVTTNFYNAKTDGPAYGHRLANHHRKKNSSACFLAVPARQRFSSLEPNVATGHRRVVAHADAILLHRGDGLLHTVETLQQHLRGHIQRRVKPDLWLTVADAPD